MPEPREADAGPIVLAPPEPFALDFWFARPFRRLRLPRWLGAFLFAAAAYGGFTLLDWLAVGAVTAYENLTRLFHLVFFQLAAILLGRETERLLDHARSLGAGRMERGRRALHSARGALLAALPIEAVYLGSELLAPGFVAADLFRHSIPLGVFHIFVGATAVWAFAYSMRVLYDLGRAPMSLRPYTEDRLLGLRPFGGGALRLVAIYELAILAAVAPLFLTSEDALTTIPTFAVLGLLGLVLFFLPLSGFRRRLQAAKAAELRWLGPRYTELVRAVRESDGARIDGGIAASLVAFEAIRRDVERIPAWPFDLGTVTRLASITFLPVVVSVVARALMILILGV